MIRYLFLNSMILSVKKLVIVLILISATCYANQADSSIVRLKNGGKIKGEIVSTTKNSITIRNQKVGEQEINWKDITFISSDEVYDSLRQNKSIIVLPAPQEKKNTLFSNISAEFMAGKGFDYNRFFGAGVRANILVSNFITIGGISIFHFGINGNPISGGDGSLFLWGPEVGMRINADDFIIEPTLSIGEGTYQVGPELYTKDGYSSLRTFDSATKSSLYITPGIGFKIKFGEMKLGMHYKYIIINDKNSSGLYISFGD